MKSIAVLIFKHKKRKPRMLCICPHSFGWCINKLLIDKSLNLLFLQHSDFIYPYWLHKVLLLISTPWSLPFPQSQSQNAQNKQVLHQQLTRIKVTRSSERTVKEKNELFYGKLFALNISPSIFFITPVNIFIVPFDFDTICSVCWRQMVTV